MVFWKAGASAGCRPDRACVPAATDSVTPLCQQSVWFFSCALPPPWGPNFLPSGFSLKKSLGRQLCPVLGGAPGTQTPGRTCLSLQLQLVVPLTIQPHRLSLFQVILKFLTLEGALYSFSRSRFILFVVTLSLFLSVGSWVRRLADLCSMCYLSGNQEHF